jgi:hypothetical protein
MTDTEIIKPWERRGHLDGWRALRDLQEDYYQVYHLATYMGAKTVPTCGTASRTGWLMTADPLRVTCAHCPTHARGLWEELWNTPVWQLDTYQRNRLRWALGFKPGMYAVINESGWPHGVEHPQ